MVEPNGLEENGADELEDSPERGRRPSELSIPKNRSTGNLPGQIGRGTEKARIRFSFDAGQAAVDYDAMARSPIMAEHEHGLGASGLRRIRQQPVPRPPTISSSGASSRTPSVGPRSTSMTITLPSSSRKSSGGAMSPPQPSPSLNYTEDLHRFPTESLHSFSFAQKSEEFIHNRQNVLKRSIEFMSKSANRLHGGATNHGIVSAQARVTGDHELQSMLELLAKAKLVGKDLPGNDEGFFSGPLTGPAHLDGENVFDQSFIPRSTSPETILSPTSSQKPELSSVSEGQGTNDEAATDESEAPLPDTAHESSESSGDRSGTTAKTSPPAAFRKPTLLRTFTDTSPLKVQHKLLDAMAEPYVAGDAAVAHPQNPPSIIQTDGGLLSPTLSHPTSAFGDSLLSATSAQFPGPSSYGVPGPHPIIPAVHGHSSRWAPAAQAIFTTESKAPWTILAANDLACLVFGVTKAEVRKMGIMEVVREERRAWLEEKLGQPGSESDHKHKPPPHSPQNRSQQGTPSSTTSFLLGRGGITAALLSKPPSRHQTQNRRSQTDDGAGSSLVARKKVVKGGLNHASNKSRGVLLCGDVVPIQKRNGSTGSASLWVKEKRGGLIWVLEEIHEDVAYIKVNDDGLVTNISGSVQPIWGDEVSTGTDIGKLIPRIPRQGIDPRTGEIDYAELSKLRYFTARNSGRVNIPAALERVSGSTDLRVSSFPHIAGIIVLTSHNLEIKSANSVFSAALFGQEHPEGLSITELIPGFDRILQILTDEDGVNLIDGIVIPEHSFRRARAFLALRDGKADAATYFLRPDGLPAKHRDGAEIKIDVQMRVVKSEKKVPAYDEDAIIEEEDSQSNTVTSSEVVYALWITYSRHLHATRHNLGAASPLLTGAETPLHQPSPGQTQIASPIEMDSDIDEPKKSTTHASLLTKQLKAAALKTAAKLTGQDLVRNEKKDKPAPVPPTTEPPKKKTIDDFVILEDMGQGAYGQVKLARYKKTGEKMVLKYVTKRRILVDTWTRDRRLGTVPLEIHVLDYLNRDGLRHPNIVEMADFFEDDINYYIEMIPHGLPGMDLFDYIELRVNMEEAECRSIFVQVARAIHHLHTKALVVHRDVKDENVVLDGDGNIKLIDFGSAAYIKNGPFDVFVGTIDYAAPEVLAGRPYRGKEQDVWALGILLYTIIYKENPFYSIDEIMDRDLRVPYVMSEDSIDLIRGMLNREVEQRMDIEAVLAHPWCRDVGADGGEGEGEGSDDD